VIAAPPAPDAALQRWLQSVPAVRCVAAAFSPWTTLNATATIPRTPVSGERFARAAFPGGAAAGLTVVAGRATGDTFWLGSVPSARAVVLHAGSEAQEDSFTAVIADAGAPPRAVAILARAPRAGAGLGLGSTRAAVEAALGAGRASSRCGFDVVRYEPEPAAASEAVMWFLYRAGVVVAIARYEAV
jgi:H2-forming N5,N10-methylenetetrahydromethanopterin dehydrogenase-like enzyme